MEPASVAQLDARMPSDQEIAGQTPARSATCFHGDLIMKYFLQSVSLLPIQKWPLSVSGKRKHTILVNCFED